MAGDDSRIWPRYGLTRTARTTARSPNIQQIPHRDELRCIFTAGRGNRWLSFDYKTIEMSTLAAECYERFGTSRLREMIQTGTDLHCLTAATVLGMSVDEFEQLKETDPSRYETERFKAKRVNFGAPAGYSARSLTQSLRVESEGKLEVDEGEIDRVLHVMKHERFPEVGRYMGEDQAETLAANLMVPVEEVNTAFNEDWMLPVVRRICNGQPFKASDGEQYRDELVEGVFTLAELNANPAFDDAIARQDTDQLKRLFMHTVVLCTGMIRGGTTWTSACNAPFQSRAAFGGRNALWKLYRAGYDLICYVHDEFNIAIPDDVDADAVARDIVRICTEEMQPFAGDIPVTVDYSMSTHWYKSAKAVRDDRGRLVLWQPEKQPLIEIEPRSLTDRAPESPPNERQRVEPTPDTPKSEPELPASLNIFHTSPRIICGDCVEVGQQLFDAGERFDLVFGDPPFNIGHGYAEHDDNMTAEQFQQFMYAWLKVGRSLLAPNGLLAMRGPDDLAAMTIRCFDDRPSHWILWHYRFGQSGSVAKATKCTTSKAHLLLFGDGTFNAPLVQSDRAVKYGDKRTQQTAASGMKVAFDIWGPDCDGPYWGRVQGNNAERWTTETGALCSHPNQLPEIYLKRVVETFSNPGDRMLVMFGGSGTETIVGHALGRQVTSIEIGPTVCQSIIKRLERGPIRL